MKLNKINSLVELFFEKYKEKKELTNQPFLKWLKTNKNDFLTWEQVKYNICLLSENLRESLSKGDRCVLLSENRPEWLIADIAIMNAFIIAISAISHSGLFSDNKTHLSPLDKLSLKFSDNKQMLYLTCSHVKKSFLLVFNHFKNG